MKWPAALPVLTLLAAAPAAAFSIVPYYDPSIAAAPNALQMQVAIAQAIAHIEALYANPGSVHIIFRQSETLEARSQSATSFYHTTYDGYRAFLRNAARTHKQNTVLATAVAHLDEGNRPPPGGFVLLTSAAARIALGQIKRTPCWDRTGTYHPECGQEFDGIVTFHSRERLDYSAHPAPGTFSVIAMAEHEIDEILGGGGTGSTLGLIAQGHPANEIGVLDPYRYALGEKDFSPAPNASAPYFSIDGGRTSLAAFDQSGRNDYGDFAGPAYVQSSECCLGALPYYGPGSPDYVMMLAIGYTPAP